MLKGYSRHVKSTEISCFDHVLTSGGAWVTTATCNNLSSFWGNQKHILLLVTQLTGTTSIKHLADFRVPSLRPRNSTAWNMLRETETICYLRLPCQKTREPSLKQKWYDLLVICTGKTTIQMWRTSREGMYCTCSDFRSSPQYSTGWWNW